MVEREKKKKKYHKLWRNIVEKDKEKREKRKEKKERKDNIESNIGEKRK